MFLALETSPGNYQAWLALSGNEDKDFARRLRKGVGADATASGATRVAGSLNFKDKYAPNFPRVTIHAAAAGPPRLRPPNSNASGSWQRPNPSPSRFAFMRLGFPATGRGRATRAASMARRSTARKPGQTCHGPILCSA